MDDKEFGERLRSGIGPPELWTLRRRTAITVGHGLHAVGVMLNAAVDPKNPDHEPIAAFSMLLQMAGELTRAAAKLLTSGQHYAGAALLRQIVEIEYLTWTFKAGHRDPKKWLNSTHRERMQDYTPAQLRQTSHGRFLAKDYQDHCEQGGHPVPTGAPLLSGQNKAGAQLFMADLITHDWRTWDHVQKWATGFPGVQPIIRAANANVFSIFHKWGDADPLYKAMVEKFPNPDLSL
jgi:hypothetical protein